jgi:hypothetical protein
MVVDSMLWWRSNHHRLGYVEAGRIHNCFYRRRKYFRGHVAVALRWEIKRREK